MNEDIVAPGEVLVLIHTAIWRLLPTCSKELWNIRTRWATAKCCGPESFNACRQAQASRTANSTLANGTSPSLSDLALPRATGNRTQLRTEAISAEGKHNQLRLVASRDAAEGSLLIHQDARIYLANIDAGKSIQTQLAPDRYAWLQILRGKVYLNEQLLETSDGAAISDESVINLRAEQDAEIMLFDLA